MAQPLAPHRLHKEHSLSTRLVVLSVGVVALTLAFAAAVTMAFMSRLLLNQIDDDLRTSGAFVATQALDQLTGAQGQVIPSPYYIYLDRQDGSAIEVVSGATGEEHGRPVGIADIIANNPDQPVTLTHPANDVPWRVLVMSTDDEEFPVIAIAYPLSLYESTTANMALVLVFIVTGTVLLGALASWVVVRSSLKPLRTIEATTKAIAAGDLSRRVPTHNMGAEVGQTAGSINTMLGHIEQAMGVQAASESNMRQFVSDASHELRTPLASVRGYAELYRMGAVPPERVPEILSRIESESARMTRLVEDLLQLARLDESRKISSQTHDLTELARNAVMDFTARAPGHPVELVPLAARAGSSAPKNADDVDSPAPPPPLTPTWAVVDPDRIFQAVTNVLTNVWRHTPEGTSVEVAVGVDGQSAVIEVRDTGPGIPKEARRDVFQRFFRMDGSRSRHSGGSGLGLAIVEAIMTSHGGSATIGPTSASGGTTVRLTVPAAPQQG